jgi:hypothetical protein
MYRCGIDVDVSQYMVYMVYMVYMLYMVYDCVFVIIYNIYIVIFSVVIQYNCVYYCDKCYLGCRCSL